jgi:hypothetical protein
MRALATGQLPVETGSLPLGTKIKKSNIFDFIQDNYKNKQDEKPNLYPCSLSAHS